MPTFSPVILRGFPSQVDRIPDLVYAEREGRQLCADLFLPRQESSGGRVPVILWVGAEGDRRRGPDLSRFFAERGIAMVAVDYRVSGDEAGAGLEDVVSAVKWVREAGGEWNLDGARMGLWGVSAGGQLAILTALATAEPGIRAVAAVYPEASRLTSSTLAGAPPLLLVHGAADTKAPVGESERLYEMLRDLDHEVTLSVIAGAGHGFLEAEFDGTRGHRVRISRPGEPEFAGDAPPFTFGTLETFFKRHL